jgi:hypothetical protein
MYSLIWQKYGLDKLREDLLMTEKAQYSVRNTFSLKKTNDDASSKIKAFYFHSYLVGLFSKSPDEAYDTYCKLVSESSSDPLTKIVNRLALIAFGRTVGFYNRLVRNPHDIQNVIGGSYHRDAALFESLIGANGFLTPGFADSSKEMPNLFPVVAYDKQYTQYITSKYTNISNISTVYSLPLGIASDMVNWSKIKISYDDSYISLFHADTTANPNIFKLPKFVGLAATMWEIAIAYANTTLPLLNHGQTSAKKDLRHFLNCNPGTIEELQTSELITRLGQIAYYYPT